jgi:acetyl-CoA acetyltransferase
VSAAFPARNRVAVVGYAHSAVERHADRPLGAIAVETALGAIADAGLDRKQVDGFVTGALFPTAGNHAVVDGVSTVSSNWLVEHLGVQPRYVAGFQGYGQIPGSVALAVNAIVSGAADHVVLHRALHNPAGRYHGNPLREARGPMQWTVPQGFFGPLATIALTYNEYLQRYGATREAMAAVLVEARRNGARIPWSHWHDRPLTADEYLSAPLINDPICRFDCDIPVDGVAAFVLTSADRARDLPHRPVYVAGYASGHPTTHRLPLHWPLDDIQAAGADVARRLWSSAGVGPGDVDLPQVYDGFSPFVYFWLEALGLCPVGEAHRFVQDGGIDADRPGGLPVLSGGGALGNGRMHGIPQMLECYLQLSGRAGPRQRPQATVAVACHSSPHLGGAVHDPLTPTGRAGATAQWMSGW